MKNFLFLVTAFASLNVFSSEIDCAKAGSKISMNKKTVTIEVQKVAMNDDLIAMAEKMVGTTEGVSIGVQLSFPKKDLKCSRVEATAFNCVGGTKKASVTLSISQSSMMGSMNSQHIRKPVKIENIEISSASLDQVLVKSSMFVKMNGDFQLDLAQSFDSAVDCK